jgi:uncharacterized protein YcbX
MGLVLWDCVQPHTWHQLLGCLNPVPHVLLQESLVDLNRQLPAPLPMNRFRPNVVVSTGGPGWVDDTWAGLRNGEHNGTAAEVELRHLLAVVCGVLWPRHRH